MKLKPRFKAGDTITDGNGVYYTVEFISKHSYKLKGGDRAYMPVSLVDKYWEPISENDTEIED